MEAVMNALKHIRAYLLLRSLVVALQPFRGLAQQNSNAAKTSVQHTPEERDGQHDFDFEIGTWKTHLSRRLHPLTGSNTWVKYEGTSVVRKVWNGRANLLELEVDDPAGHLEGLSLRLYNPESHQWTHNALAHLMLSIEMLGAFVRDTRGLSPDAQRALLAEAHRVLSGMDYERAQQGGLP